MIGNYVRPLATRLLPLICVLMFTASAAAQDEQMPSEPADGVAAQPEPPGLEPEAAPPKKAVSQPPATEEAAGESYVWFLLRGGGPIGLVIILQSIVTVALTVKYLLELRRDKLIPPGLIAQFEERIKEKKYQEAYELTRNDGTFLGKVLAAGLGKLSAGYPQAIEAMHEVGEDESMKLEHRLSWLALMGTTGPLLGLFGTVVGMVDSFRIIATMETQPKPNQLADGISVALITTLDGMVVAIIATIAFMLLKNQASRLVLEVGMVSESLMSRFGGLARAGRAAGTTSGQSEAP
jgi:biopolymer transport protein ExbB